MKHCLIFLITTCFIPASHTAENQALLAGNNNQLYNNLQPAPAPAQLLVQAPLPLGPDDPANAAPVVATQAETPDFFSVCLEGLASQGIGTAWLLGYSAYECGKHGTREKDGTTHCGSFPNGNHYVAYGPMVVLGTCWFFRTMFRLGKPLLRRCRNGN